MKNVLKSQEHKLAFSAASAMAIFFTVCAFIMHLWPEQSLQLTADMLHLKNLDIIAPDLQVTPANFISGIFQWFLYTYLYVWLASAIYNRICKSKNNNKPIN